MKYIWEREGNELIINNSYRYVIYFKGSFGPPHIGHFSAVKKFLDMGANIKVLIHQKGIEKRHGVPKDLNRHIWNIYITDILKTNKVELIQYKGNKDILTHNWVKKCDSFVLIRGDEYPDKLKGEHELYKGFRHIINGINKLHKSIYMYVMVRNKEVISATKFVNSLILHKNSENIVKYEAISKFLPEGLDISMKYNIINVLQRCKLKV